MAEKLVKAALIGWAVAFFLVIVVTGEFPDSEDKFRIILFLSLAPGTIVGIITAYIIEKANKSPKTEITLESKLQELKRLLEQGVLTQEEFDEQKKKILNENL